MNLELLYDRILPVLTLNRQKMKERILIGEKNSWHSC